MSKTNEYQCAMCGNTYTKSISDEEAMQETQAYWPDASQQECAVVCDDCYQQIKPDVHPQEYGASLAEMVTPPVLSWNQYEVEFFCTTRRIPAPTIVSVCYTTYTLRRPKQD